jgi:hypothetical protein
LISLKESRKRLCKPRDINNIPYVLPKDIIDKHGILFYNHFNNLYKKDRFGHLSLKNGTSGIDYAKYREIVVTLLRPIGFI